MSDFAKAPAPDATGKCGELETVAQAHFDEFGEFDDIAWIKGFHPHPECIQLVTRSQAEELLAAERAENDELNSLLGISEFTIGNKNAIIQRLERKIEEVRLSSEGKDNEILRIQADNAAKDAEKEAFAEEIKEAAYEAWPEANDVGSDAPQIIRQLSQERDKLEDKLAATRAENARLMKINEAHCQTVNTLTVDGARLDGIIRDLKADNAALTARIKELEIERDEALDDAKFAERIATKREIDANASVEALEAKLAAAEKLGVRHE